MNEQPPLHAVFTIVPPAGTYAAARTLHILRGDITRQDTEAIVNAANSTLLGGGGVDGAIHRAGGPAILAECRRIVARIGALPPGEAVVTTSGALPAPYVIHTVGPVWRGGHCQEAAVLRRAYASCLALARERGFRSVAFPSISTGAYRFPVAAAAGIAIAAILEALRAGEHPEEVRLVTWHDEDFETYRREAARRTAGGGV